MNRNVLYIVIAVLLVVVIALGWKYYQDQNSSRVEIKLDGSGVSVQTD